MENSDAIGNCKVQPHHIDDPIRLFDHERSRVLYCSKRRDVTIADPDYLEFVETSENIQKMSKEIILPLYNSNSSILPLTFFDIPSNVEFLDQCRPVFIKLVDCDKYPRYHKRYINVEKHNKLNESNYFEIISSDEDENYETIKKQSSEKNKAIGENYTKLNSLSNITSVSKSFPAKVFTDGYIRKNNLQNNNAIDVKRNESITGYNNQASVEAEQRKINEYARIIDKAYQKVTKLINPISSENNYNTGYKSSKISPNVDKIELNRNNELPNARNLVSYGNQNLLDCKDAESIDFAKVDKNVVGEASYIKTQAPLYRSVSVKPGLKIIDKNSANSDHEISEVKNNGSCSPILPPPVKKKNLGKKNLETLPRSNYGIESSKVCNTKFFSASREIPHYHKNHSHIPIPKAKHSVNVFQTIPVIISPATKTYDDSKTYISPSFHHYQFSQEPSKSNFKQSISMDGLDRYPSPTSNSKTILISQKQQNTFHPNIDTTQKFPIQSLEPFEYAYLNQANNGISVTQKNTQDISHISFPNYVSNYSLQNFEPFNYNKTIVPAVSSRTLQTFKQLPQYQPNIQRNQKSRLQNHHLISNNDNLICIDTHQTPSGPRLPNNNKKMVVCRKPELGESQSLTGTENTIKNSGLLIGSEKLNKQSYISKILEMNISTLNAAEQSHRMYEYKHQNDNKVVKNIDEPVTKVYSPPILPIPSYEKTFEILAKVNLSNLEKDPTLTNIPQSTSQNSYSIANSDTRSTALRKKINENFKKISGKISIADYKKRLQIENF